MKPATWCCVAAFAILSACNNNSSNTSETSPTTTTVPADDSVRALVIKLHDEAMPKMGKLIGFQKQAQAQIDSLQKTSGKSLAGRILTLKQLKDQLAAAEKGMNDWMAQVNLDNQLPTIEERTAYYLDQQTKAKKMRDEIFIALDSAAAIMKQ